MILKSVFRQDIYLLIIVNDILLITRVSINGKVVLLVQICKDMVLSNLWYSVIKLVNRHLIPVSSYVVFLLHLSSTYKGFRMVFQVILHDFMSINLDLDSVFYGNYRFVSRISFIAIRKDRLVIAIYISNSLKPAIYAVIEDYFELIYSIDRESVKTPFRLNSNDYNEELEIISVKRCSNAIPSDISIFAIINFNF